MKNRLTARATGLLRGALDVAEEDDARLVRVVARPVDVGLVEEQILAVAPHVRLAVDVDEAVLGVRRDEPEVVADRAAEGVPVLDQLAVGREQREHGAVDRGDALEERHRPGARLAGGGEEVAVPLEVEALPAALEERVERQVVVGIGLLDAALFQEGGGLVANHLPVLAEGTELREVLPVQDGPVGHARLEVERGV